MILSNWPDWMLIRKSNKLEQGHSFLVSNANIVFDVYFEDQELESRIPHFEPEYDSNGQPIIEEVIGYDEGGEIWSLISNQ